MGLINCPECDARISEYASHCIHCGYNFNDENGNHVTIERTKKKFKTQGVLSTLLMIVGGLMICNEYNRNLAFWLIVIGFAWNSVNAIRIWWNHG